MKVIGIGLPKTGTKSLNEALKILGYRSLHYPAKYHLRIMTQGNYTIPDQWDAITNTAEDFYPVLAKMYPDAKFILTTRKMKDWLRSWSKKDRAFGSQSHVGRLNRIRVFGTSRYVAERFEYVFKEHEEAARRFFADSLERLLVISLEDLNKWEPLCRFLDKPIPPMAFPHVKKKVK